MKQFILIGHTPENTSGLWLIQKPHDGKPIVWMDSQTWLRPIEICSDQSIKALPEELRALVRRWQGRKQEIEAAYQPSWYSKLVSTNFVYQQKHYKIEAAAFGLSQAVFECIQNELDKELEALGCPYVRSVGFID